MTPPSTILAPDRERASALAWGTMCVLAALQIGIATKLLTSDPPLPSSSTTPTPIQKMAVVPPPRSGMVPEIGQIAAPPPPAERMPGTLVPPAPAPSVVSLAPPPIGSFERTSAAPSPVATPTIIPPPSVPTPPQPVVPAPAVTAPPAATPTVSPSLAPAVPSVPATPPKSEPPPAISDTFTPAPVKPDAATALLRDVNYVVTTAKEIRGLSDMQGALELLKRADQLTPDHPAIIAEIAQTYEQMGVAAKATDNWRRIQLLGETKAGSFYDLASRRLGAGPAGVAAPAASGGSGLDGEKHLRLGACEVKRDFSVGTSERYVLRVPIVRAGTQPVDGKAVNLEVFFFDRVNGVQVAQTIAPEPVETWRSSPVDWSGTGEETLDVIYQLPAMSAAEIQQHGRRSYYGYMLRLYYNNKLQDVAAEPHDLLGFGSAPGTAPASGGNPLLPPVGR